MEPADSLIESARAFAREHPERAEFVKRLIQSIERIVNEFEGETREQLLAEARSTLERQREIQDNTTTALQALEHLKDQQERLAKALESLAMVRPPNATIH